MNLYEYTSPRSGPSISPARAIVFVVDNGASVRESLGLLNGRRVAPIISSRRVP